MRSIVVFCVISLAAALPAAAQSTYVSGSLLGEFSRFDGIDVDDDDALPILSDLSTSRNGKTVGFDARIGRALGERWGGEVAYARGGVNEQSRTINPFPVIVPPLPGFPTLPPIITTFEFELTREEQHSTFTVSAWVRQDLERVALVFSGGVGFNRVESEQNIRITDNSLAISVPYPANTETVGYGVGPAVGAEAIFDVADHAGVTAGVRLHGVNGGWLIRPSVGVRWTF